MSDYEYGPLDTYEVIWKSGHVEQVKGHQVLLPPMDFGGLFGEKRRIPIRDTHVMIHGQIDGRWKLVLAAPADDIVSVRLVTSIELAEGRSS